MKKALLLFSIFFLPIISFSQDKLSSNNVRAVSAYNRSNLSLGQKLYNTAIRDLEEALRFDPNFIEAHYRLGDVYKKLSEYRKSLNRYQYVESINPTITKHLGFEIAECYFNLHRYDSALTYFETYAQVPDLSENRRKVLDKYLVNTRFSVEAIKTQIPYEPKNLGAGINTIYQEYLPTVTADDSTIIFTRRSNQEDFYVSTKGNENLWIKALPLSTAINTTGNEGAQCISPDGQYLYFAGCGREDGLGKCDIYFSKLVGNNWSKPQNIGAPINSPYWESQPSLSADGMRLYFVSDRKGGYGSYDIYVSRNLGNGKWSNPVNLGPNINSAGSELSPFIHPDNQTLYFSSDGWPGFGQNDIFYVKKSGKFAWEKPVNIGFPINTSQEESSLFISNDGKKAYFASSSLQGFGGLDLYSFELYEKARPNMVTYVKGNVFDKNTAQKLFSTVEIIDINTGDTVAQTTSNEATGQFLASLPVGKTYAFNVYREGYLFYSDQFILENKKFVEAFKLPVPLSPITVGAKISLRNIFFETNSFKLKNESKYELVKLNEFLKGNPSVRIEISGHTDNVGADLANQTLSTNRAKAVYDYMIKQGIDPKRLVFKGYGKTQPMDVNSTEAGRARNRRTEVKIIE
ncbi:MAG: OmpA family protein [Sphingobacteriales bacterium]|nr:OmpA family protein [Sphingobacteriales bacterium]